MPLFKYTALTNNHISHRIYKYTYIVIAIVQKYTIRNYEVMNSLILVQTGVTS